MARKIWPNPEEVEVQFVLLKTLFHIMRNLTFALIQRVFLERFFYLNPNLLGGSNINLQSKDKEIFGRKSANAINKEMPHLTRSYLEFCRTHSLEQITTRSTRVADQTATLVDHILTNSPDKVSQSGIIDLGLSDRDLMYCTRKKSLPKSHKHKEIFLEKVFHWKVFGDLKMDHFPKLSDLHLCKCCLLRFYI